MPVSAGDIREKKSVRAPDWLSAEARAVWEGLNAGVVAEADGDALAVYCCAVADYVRAQEALDKSGPVIRGHHGGLVRNPLNLVRNENAQMIRQLGRQLGIIAATGRGTAEASAPAGYRNQAATERTITGLRAGGRLEEVERSGNRTGPPSGAGARLRRPLTLPGADRQPGPGAAGHAAHAARDRRSSKRRPAVSMSSSPTCPPRWATPRSPDRPTVGGRWARLAAVVRQPFMPWQIQVSDVAGEIEPSTGLPAYREVRVTVPRQSGKTTLILVVEVDRCIAYGPDQHVLYAAQDRNNSRAKWEEQVEALEAHAARRVRFARAAETGLERMVWPATGSTIGITASGESSGHGQTLDVGVIDEAFAQQDDRLVQAFRPAMMTRPDAQQWVLSTMGTEESVFLHDRIDDGRARVEAGERSGVAFFEWSAEDDDDPRRPAHVVAVHARSWPHGDRGGGPS